MDKTKIVMKPIPGRDAYEVEGYIIDQWLRDMNPFTKEELETLKSAIVEATIRGGHFMSFTQALVKLYNKIEEILNERKESNTKIR